MEFPVAVGGGWSAIGVISKLRTALKDCEDKKMQEELARLDTALPMVKAVLQAVDQVLCTDNNPRLENWLWRLRDAADQADDVMDEMVYDFQKKEAEAGGSKLGKAVFNIKTVFHRAVDKDPLSKRLKAAVKEIDGVVAGVVEFYHLASLVKNQKEMVKTSAIIDRETSSVFNMGTHVSVRKKEKAEIIKKLLNPECQNKGINYSVLPIIGQGGVGKTTLAQLVYNDPDVGKCFNLRIWVSMNTEFDVVSLTKKLYESVFKQNAAFDNLDVIQRYLVDGLESKRFLVVFDDAWNDSDRVGWEKLLAPFKDGGSGSMILLTTRMESVARLTGPNLMDPIYLKGLNDDDMWNILKGCVFGDENRNCDEELEKIGREIVEKLKGSPLAAKTVGEILRSDLSVKHWTSVLKSELWNLEHRQDDIMPALRLTYQYLPSHLKPCFSFCSIFPQNHIFIKDDLIRMWIALGLVQQDDNDAKTPEEVGSKYFDDMLNKSIFIRANQDYHGNDTAPLWHYRNEEQHSEGYVMHDLMQDLATLVSQGECFTTNTDGPVDIPKTVRHLYVHVSDPRELSISDISDLKNLHTLILHFDESDSSNLDSLVNEVLKIMKKLRVLTLFAHNLSEFPESASNLLHLRYLRLSSFKLRAPPKSMPKLYFLKTQIFNEPSTGVSEEADHVLGSPSNLRLPHFCGCGDLIKRDKSLRGSERVEH